MSTKAIEEKKGRTNKDLTAEEDRWTGGQAAHTLTIIGQHNPTIKDIVCLHDGLLADLMSAIKRGTAPPRREFRQALRLSWMTIRVGTPPCAYGQVNAEEFCRHLGLYHRVSVSAFDMMRSWQFTMAKQPADVDLLIYTTFQLTGKHGTSNISDVLAGVSKVGELPASSEDGPRLREQYLNQPKGECLLMAMQTIGIPYGNPRIFEVSCDDRDGTQLHSRAAHDQQDFHPRELWVVRSGVKSISS